MAVFITTIFAHLKKVFVVNWLQWHQKLQHLFRGALYNTWKCEKCTVPLLRLDIKNPFKIRQYLASSNLESCLKSLWCIKVPSFQLTVKKQKNCSLLVETFSLTFMVGCRRCDWIGAVDKTDAGHRNEKRFYSNCDFQFERTVQILVAANWNNFKGLSCSRWYNIFA